MKFLYLLYTLKRTDYKKLFLYINWLSVSNEKRKITIIYDVLVCFFRYNTVFLDYFYLRFFEKSDSEKREYLNTLYMFRFQKKYNNEKYKVYFADKSKFYLKFKDFIFHNHILLTANKNNEFEKWLQNGNGVEYFVKNKSGQVGKNIEKFTLNRDNNKIIINNTFSAEEYFRHLLLSDLDLVEEKLNQHHVLNNIYPDSLNTLRVITFLNNRNEVEILGTILRIGFDKYIDNFDSGGISVVVESDGTIKRKAIIKDPREQKEFEKHPVTDSQITGIRIPNWENVIEIVTKAAKVIPEVSTVGWDVVILESGVFLLEGNHNWDKTHWQLSYGKGFKKLMNNLQDSNKLNSH
jgi:putative polysaccharide biosynthesis protein